MSLSRKELEDLKPMIDRTVHKFLGFSEATLSTAALNCLNKGYDRRKTVGKCHSFAVVHWKNARRNVDEREPKLVPSF